MRGFFGRYLALSAVFVIAVLYQGRASLGYLRLLLRPHEITAAPFWLLAESSIIDQVSDGASKAGLRGGDRLLAINGRPYTGSAVLGETLATVHPGDTISVRISRASGEHTFITPVSALVEGSLGPGEWAMVAEFGLLMPVFSIALGFWVAAIRPRDPPAWIVLGMMLSFANLNDPQIASWAAWLRGISVAYHGLCRLLWPVWILLFGLYFPDTLAWERRHPWVKWILIAPLGAYSLATVVVLIGSLENVSAIEPLARALERLEVVNGAMWLLAIAVFLACLIARRRLETSADARRRIRMLLFGSSVALGPALLLNLVRLAQAQETTYSAYFLATILSELPVFLFPLTLAYVIVVERAMDVRVAVRQGVRYAFARRGIRLVQLVLISAVAVTAYQLAYRFDNWAASGVLILAAIFLILRLRRLGERLAAWTDRRFFREAYNAEQILTELSNNVRTMVETAPLIETVARRIAESLHVSRVAFLLNGEGTYRPAYALGYSSTPAVSFSPGAATVKHLAHRKEPITVYFEDRNSWINREHEIAAAERDTLRALQPELLLPLAVQERLLGFIALGQKKSEEPYSRSDLALLQTVASQTGLALENSRLTATVAEEVARRERLNRELEIAREVQARLFPQHLPAVPGLDYAGSCRPAQEVGGDYYDFFPLPDGSFTYVVGDVSGKGIAAALLMASQQAWLRGQIVADPRDLGAVMRNFNRHVYESSAADRFVTLFVARYEPAGRALTYVNAGHNAPFVLRGGAVIRLDCAGLVAGAFPDASYEQTVFALAPGDILITFTDGVSEAMNPAEEDWGERRLIQAASGCGDLAAGEIIRRLMQAVDEFAAGARQYDDATLVVLRVVE